MLQLDLEEKEREVREGRLEAKWRLVYPDLDNIQYTGPDVKQVLPNLAAYVPNRIYN